MLKETLAARENSARQNIAMVPDNHTLYAEAPAVTDENSSNSANADEGTSATKTVAPQAQAPASKQAAATKGNQVCFFHCTVHSFI